MRRSPVAHERQHLGCQIARYLPAARTGRIARMQQAHRIARHEAVGVEEVLLQPEAREAPLQIAVAIAGHAMAQDQVLGAGRRADRVGLHEARRADRAAPAWSAAAANPAPPAGATPGMVSLPAIRFSAPAAVPPARAPEAGTGGRRAGPTTTGRSIRIGCATIASIRAASVLAGSSRPEFGVRRAAPTQQLARRHVHTPQQIEQFSPAGRRLQVLDHTRLDAGVEDRPEHLA